MNRQILQQLIRTEIQNVAFENLKNLNSQKKAMATHDYLNSKSVTEDDIDHTLFHGGDIPKKEDKYRGKITIKEGVDSNLKITTGEIKDFENSFKEILDNIPSASIVFDKQKNGYSIIATKRPDGVEAKASGIINLGDNGKVVWSYSILNGFNLNAQNLKLTESNKTMFEALANHYNDWQKNWREKLNLPGEPTVSDIDNVSAPAQNGGVPASIGASPTTPATPSTPAAAPPGE